MPYPAAPAWGPPPPVKPKGGGRKVFGILLIVFGALPLLLGVGVLGKAVINAQQTTGNDAFAAVAWHNLTTDQVFPDHIVDPDRVATPGVTHNGEGWSRQGIAKETSCAEAFRDDFAQSAETAGCVTALRATYVDISGTTAATIGIAVVGSYEQADELAGEFNWADNPGPLVRAVPVPGTPAATWADGVAVSGGATTVGLSTNSPPYVAAITVGPVDGSHSVGVLPGQWASDGRSERLIDWNVGSQLVNVFGRQFADAMEK